MMENGAGASFPVVFFDGESETNIGNVVVYQSTEFKNFQSFLSQKIGISPHQISVYLVDRKKSTSSPESQRKILITNKVSFAAVIREKDCFFLVVLKRSRRERRRKPRQGLEEFDDYSSRNKASPPEKLLLLRRNHENPPFSGFVSPYYDQIAPPYSGSEIADYESRLQILQIEREKYLMSANSSPYRRNSGVVCEECLSAANKGRSVPFHWCVYDAVTVGFRSPAGPIARPAKASD